MSDRCQLQIEEVSVVHGPDPYPFRTYRLVFTIVIEIPRLSSRRIKPRQTRSVQQRNNIQSSVEEGMMLSIFVLAFASGPLLYALLTEMLGLQVALQTINLMFVALNRAAGQSNFDANDACSLLCWSRRFGPASSWWQHHRKMSEAEERRTAMGMSSLAPLLGPAIGAIIEG